MSRSNGYTTADGIERAPYIIESLIHEEINTEHNIAVSSVNVGAATVTFSNTASTEDDFYNGAVLHAPSTNKTFNITDYVGSTRTATVTGLTASGDIPTTDRYFITSINVNVNESSFDAVGNTTDGTRKDWEFRFAQVDEINSRDLLNELCYFSFCALTKEYDQFYLQDLDVKTPSVTLSSPLYQNGDPMVSVSKTPIDLVYTDFELLYNWNFGTQKYESREFVNRDTTTQSFYLGSIYKNRCRDAQNDVLKGGRRKLKIESKYFNDSITASYFLQRIIKWHTEQHMRVIWWGNLKDHINLLIGDRVFINFPDIIPSGYNSTASFIIERKTIKTEKRKWGVRLQCLELPV